MNKQEPIAPVAAPLSGPMIDLTATRRNARTAGGLYLAFLVIGGLAEFSRSTFLVAGDPAATMVRIQAGETLFRLGSYSDLVGEAIFVLLGLACYRLFAAVHRGGARALLALVLAGVPIAMLSLLGQFAAASFAAAGQAEACALALALAKQGSLIAEIFWGLWLAPLGWLSWRSGFIPRPIAGLLMAACLGWLADSCIGLVFPTATAFAAPGLALVTVAELGMIFWLVVFGARPRRSPALGHGSAHVQSPAAPAAS